MKIFKSLLVCIGGFALSACYEPTDTDDLPANPTSWTGAGDYEYGSSYRGLSVGLAGQDMYLFSESGSVWHWSNVLDGEFSGPYRLTSIAQTFSLGWHEQSFLHGNLVGRTDNLDLFHTEQGYFGYYAQKRIPPRGSQAISTGEGTFNIVEICDMATPDKNNGWVLPYFNDSHLFLSIRACNSSRCVGGVVEAQFNSQMSQWWIKTTSGQQHAQVHRAGGWLFSNECMPITATRWSDTSVGAAVEEYLIVADPSIDEITTYKASNLKAGAVDFHRYSSSTAEILDISADGIQQGSVHYSFIQALWRDGSGANLQHYTATNGALPDSPFLTEPVSRRTTQVQGFGRGELNDIRGKGYLMTLGSTAVIREYQ